MFLKHWKNHHKKPNASQEQQFPYLGQLQLVRIRCPELCGDKTKPDPGSEGSIGSAHSGRAIVSWTHWVLILASRSNRHFLFEGQGQGTGREKRNELVEFGLGP